MGSKASRPSSTYDNRVYEEDLVKGLERLEMYDELSKRIRKRAHEEDQHHILSSPKLRMFAKYRELPIIANEVCRLIRSNVAAAVEGYNGATGRHLETKSTLKSLGRPSATNDFLRRAFDTLDEIQHHARQAAHEARLLEDDDDTAPWYGPIQRDIEAFLDPPPGGTRDTSKDYDDLERRLVDHHNRASHIDDDLHNSVGDDDAEEAEPRRSLEAGPRTPRGQKARADLSKVGIAILYFSSKVIWSYYQPALHQLLVQRDLTTDLNFKRRVLEKYDETTDLDVEKEALFAAVEVVRLLKPLRHIRLLDFGPVTHIAARFIKPRPSPTSVTDVE